MEDIEIYEYRRLDLRDAVVLDGFPSVGLVSTIAASYVVSSLNMELIGVMDSVYFPTVSVVRDGDPHHPVRFYAGDLEGPEGDWTRLVVFLSEFQPPANLIKMICNTMLDWVQDQRCACLISPEGLVVEGELPVLTSQEAEETDEEGGEDDEQAEENMGGGNERKKGNNTMSPVGNGSEKQVYGLSSLPSGREKLGRADIPIFPEGLISGIPGVLLNEGKRRNFEVTCLLAEARDKIPDARAAAKILETMQDLIPYFKMDLTPLFAEADLLEAKLKGMQTMSKPGGKKTRPTMSMYG